MTCWGSGVPVSGVSLTWLACFDLLICSLASSQVSMDAISPALETEFYNPLYSRAEVGRAWGERPVPDPSTEQAALSLRFS